jgi:predicted N-acetyltransferase YhbS
MATRTALSVARRSSSRRLASPPPRPIVLPPQAAAATLKLAHAKTGDHPAIHRLLVSVFHGPTAAEFHSQLDEPGYQPADRLVVRDGDQIAAHLRLAPQRIAHDGTELPAARFMDLATAPEYRERGLATALLAAGERAAREKGLLVAVTRTRAAALFARQGWSICGRYVFSTAAPRQVLAALGATAGGTLDDGNRSGGPLFQQRAEPIHVRPLRRVELPAIVRLYDANLAGRSGWPRRSEEYWDWLLSRGACDQVFVAATSPEQADLAKLLESIVGYAFVRQGRLVEVVADPRRPEVARHLAARVCADASEQGDWLVRCDAPPDHSLHALLREAGGRLVSQQQLDGEVFMAKILDPLTLLRQTAGSLRERAKAARIGPGARLGIELRSGNSRGASGLVERYCLHFGRQSAQLETGTPCRHAIVLRYSDLAPLLLADCSAEEQLATGRLRATTRKARTLALALFPAARWWRPPLDDLLA